MRLSLEFSRFYFNVFQNDLEIDYTTKDIFCGTLGTITVNNLGTNYGYELLNVDTNTVAVPFSANNGASFDIATKGAYQVRIVQLDPNTGNPITNACIFETPKLGILEREYEVNITTKPVDCNGLGAITVQALNVFANYNYELRLDDGTNSGAGSFIADNRANTDNNFTFNNVAAGDYIVITGTDDSCTNTQNSTVVKIEDLALTATTTTNISCNPGFVTLAVTGGVPDPDYKMAIWSKDGTALYTSISDIPESAFQPNSDFIFGYDYPTDPNDPLIYTPGEEGTYTFVAVDSSNCSIISNSVIIEDLGVVTVVISGDMVRCADESSGSIILTTTGGVAPYKYSIDNGITFQDTNTFVNLSAANYQITVTDANTPACFFKTNYKVTQPFTLNASATITQTQACNPGSGAQVQILNVNGGTGSYTYSFDGGTEYTNSNTALLPSGTYSLAVKDANNCLKNLEITVPDPVTVPTVTDEVTYNCLGQAIVTMTPSNTDDFTYSYAFDGTANTPSNEPVFSNVATGLHTVTVGYASSITPQQSRLLYEDFGAGPNTSIAEVESNYCYEPQDGSNPGCNIDNTIRIADGEYSVTSIIQQPYGSWTVPRDHTGITDGRYLAINIGSIAGINGVIYAKRNIEVLPNLDLSISLWAFTITGGDPADILIELVDPSGTVISSFTSGDIPNGVDPDDWKNYTTELNPGNNTNIDFVIRTNKNTTGGNDLGLDDILVSQTPEVCEETLTYDINITAGIPIGATITNVTDVSCSGLSDGAITFEFNNFDAATGFEYSEDGGANWLTSMSATVTTNAIFSAGSQSIRVRKVADNTCTATASTTINEPSPIIPNLQETKPFMCSNSGATLTATATGGNGTYTYQLEDTSGTVITAYQSSGIFNPVTAGNYLVSIKDLNNCTSNTTVPIVITTPEVPTFTLSAATCYTGNSGGVIKATVSTGNDDYQFRINGGLWNAPLTANGIFYDFTGLANGSYTVEVKDGFGCISLAQSYTISPKITYDIAVVNTSSCNSGSITITATGGNAGLIYAFVPATTSPSGVFGSSNTTAIATGNEGSYDVYIRDNNGNTPFCEIQETVTVSAGNPLAISTSLTNPTCNGDTGVIALTITTGESPFEIALVDNDHSGAANSTITDADRLTHNYFNLAPGEYTVTVTDTYDCTQSSTVTITNPAELTATLGGILPAACDDPDINKRTYPYNGISYF